MEAFRCETGIRVVPTQNFPIFFLTPDGGHGAGRGHPRPLPAPRIFPTALLCDKYWLR